ncbi:MAG: SprT-like domain-containing protein [Defluviitaleaceae bacterium]|nr:SprT-like domain-containing protein [Defluviitaleaceae bacterium]
MNGKVTIQSAIDELQRNFERLNKKYFGGELDRPVITILTDSTSGAYGWITVNKVWSSKSKKYFREINICAEHLNRPPELVITTLLHEMVHLYHIEKGIQDTSRAGTYHNSKFKDTAEKCGLIVEKSVKYGYCITTPSVELVEYVKENCRSGCFKLERMKTYRDGTPKTTVTGKDGKERTTSRTKQSMRKYTCPTCGLIIRASKDIAGKLLCIDCQEILSEK